jgi:hypothetical protein
MQTGLPVSITFKDGKLQTVARETAIRVNSEGNAWLEAHRGKPGINVTGHWYEKAWGTLNLEQDEATGDVIGSSNDYDLTGIVNGKKLYLILGYTAKFRNDYSAVLVLNGESALEGKHESGLMKDEGKGRSMSLVKR